ncbi:MAG: LPXTG cell wall anchor domain-containing protein [Hyphomicrobiaceae bacterium]
METSTIAWLAGGLAVILLAMFFWLRRREQREIASWDETNERWPDEETKSMD